MPPKQVGRSGVADYIQSKDPVDGKRVGDNGSNDDLRVEVPKTVQTANSRQPRTQRSDSGHHHVHDHQKEANQPSNVKQPFYGTDAGSVGGTSETPSVHEVHPVQTTHANQTSRPQPEAQYSEGDFDDHEESDEYGSDDLPDDPLYNGMSESAIRKKQIVDAHLARKRAGASLPYMHGDSYPSTTSGPPSIYEPEARKAAPMKPPVPQPLQGRGRGQSQAQQIQQHQHQVPPVGMPLTWSDAAVPSVPKLTFASAAVPRANAKNKALAADQASREMTTRGPREPFAALNNQLPPKPKADGATRPLTTKGRPQDEQQLPRGQEHLETSRKAGRYPDPIPPNAISPVAQSPPPKQPQNAADLSDGQEREEEKTPVEVQQPLKLDYETKQLYMMEYSDLISQPFDTGPRDEHLSLPDVARDESIENQMAAVINFHPKDQHAFLTSLPIDEWEQAGDWFLGKFGETLSTLKKLRQEKRAAAHAFEQEVEARHVAVTQKRKLTEAALAEMRTSGNLVLEGTPKRSKKTK